MSQNCTHNSWENEIWESYGCFSVFATPGLLGCCCIFFSNFSTSSMTICSTSFPPIHLAATIYLPGERQGREEGSPMTSFLAYKIPIMLPWFLLPSCISSLTCGATHVPSMICAECFRHPLALADTLPDPCHFMGKISKAGIKKSKDPRWYSSHPLSSWMWLTEDPKIDSDFFKKIITSAQGEPVKTIIVVNLNL